MSEASVESEGIIQVMPETLANKIAAGEVVQRPASVLKELLENALDAGAEQIDVHLKEAGSELVQVVDDGCGMTTRDAEACFRRHATSKIQSVDDLNRIQTLGFRGEALASIAAVSRVTLKTKRTDDAAGIQAQVDGGEVVDKKPCAMPAGTSIAVRSLFYNVPARRNFLKSPATELKHLLETFQFIALSNPDVGFSLAHKGQTLYRLQKADTDGRLEALTQRIDQLFDDEYAGRLVSVRDSTSYVEAAGVVGNPESARRSRGEQFLFVNGRHVRSRYLSHAVKTAYGDMLPDGTFPFFALFLDIDPRHVDINVHPTKAEVKFDDESGVYAFLRSAVKRGLGRAHLTPQLDDEQEGEGRKDPAPSSSGSGRPRSFSALSTPDASGEASSSSGAPASRPQAASPKPQRDTSTASPGTVSRKLYEGMSSDRSADQPGQRDRKEQALDGGRLLWQVADRYIVTDMEAGLMLVDQQAAHARILYEQAQHHLAEEAGPSQQLLFPVTVDLNPGRHALLEELLPELRQLGFEVELLSGRSAVVRAIPVDVRGEEAPEELLEELLEQYQSDANRPEVRHRERLARSVAQRGAVRPGTPLEVEAMEALLDRLMRCEMPYAGPTGKPTMIKIPVEEIDKRFSQ